MYHLLCMDLTFIFHNGPVSKEYRIGWSPKTGRNTSFIYSEEREEEGTAVW